MKKVVNLLFDIIIIQVIRFFIMCFLLILPITFIIFQNSKGKSIDLTGLNVSQMINSNSYLLNFINISSSIALLLATIILFCKIRNKKFDEVKKFFLNDKAKVLHSLIGIFAGFVSFGLVMIILNFSGNYSILSVELSVSRFIDIIILFVFAYITVFCEEFFFRGYIFSYTKNKINPVLIGLISNIVFLILGLNHTTITIISIVNIFLISLVCCLFASMFKSFFASAGFRTSWTVMSILFSNTKMFIVYKTRLFNINVTKQNAITTYNSIGIVNNAYITLILVITIISLISSYKCLKSRIQPDK